MGLITSKVAICNLALDHLSHEEIVLSIDSPNTKAEVICSRWYDQSRVELLREQVWNFARKRGTLSLNVYSPSFGYANAYNLPNDFVRLVFVGDDTYRHSDYELEGNQILIDNSGGASLTLGYIRNEEDVSIFDSLFIKTLALQLAVNIAYKFTLKNTVVERLFSQLTQAKILARAIDGQERPPRRRQSPTLLNSRKQIGRNKLSTIYEV